MQELLERIETIQKREIQQVLDAVLILFFNKTI